ncbi:hypothetical protein Tco_1315248 [Tanacetum coccineum]
MCRHQGYMIKDMERKCVTTDEFWKVHGKVDQVLHEIVPKITERATNDLIEDNLKRVVADTVIQERDAFESEVHALISKEFDAHAPKIIDLLKHYVQTSVIQVHPTISTSIDTTLSVDLQQKLYLKMKSNLQDQANDLALWDVLKRKFEKSSTSNSSSRDDNFHSQHHDDHQDDDAPPKREKRVKRHKTSKISKFAKGLQKLSRITTDQLYGLDFMEQIIVMRENDKPDSFSEADFKYLNKNDIEDLYYLCRNKKVNYRETKLMNSLITFIRSHVIWERVHDFQLGIESYQIRVHLTALTLIFLGIEAHEPYSIVDKPNTSLIYLNSKDEKRVMYLLEIVKFCDATLEKVLNEVKLRIFQNQFLKKPPRLAELDLVIMKAFEREISKRLSHRQQMRMWESFMNGRPPMMKRL